MKFYHKPVKPAPKTYKQAIRKGLWFGVGLFAFVAVVLLSAHALVSMI